MKYEKFDCFSVLSFVHITIFLILLPRITSLTICVLLLFWLSPSLILKFEVVKTEDNEKAMCMINQSRFQIVLF